MALLARFAREAGRGGERCGIVGLPDVLQAAVLSEAPDKGRARLGGRCDAGGSPGMTPPVAVLPPARVRKGGTRTGCWGEVRFPGVTLLKCADRNHGAGWQTSCSEFKDTTDAGPVTGALMAPTGTGACRRSDVCRAEVSPLAAVLTRAAASVALPAPCERWTDRLGGRCSPEGSTDVCTCLVTCRGKHAVGCILCVQITAFEITV